MRLMMNTFYVVSSNADGENIPYFFEMTWKPNLPIFDLHAESPESKKFADTYRVKAKTDDLKVDLLINDYLASDDFLEMCSSMHADYLSVPIKVFLDDGSEPAKRYNFFCVKIRLWALNQDKSVYQFADEGLLRSQEERGCGPVYERIDSFVFKDEVVEDLFYCEEIKQVICSSKFKAEFELRQFSGLNFIAIDGSYVYAPWDDFLS